MDLNADCVNHEHDDGLPDRDLRGHVLAAGIRAAEYELSMHGYADVERSAEILHVALGDALEDGQHDDERN
jgi:hypothetical protein